MCAITQHLCLMTHTHMNESEHTYTCVMAHMSETWQRFELAMTFELVVVQIDVRHRVE